MMQTYTVLGVYPDDHARFGESVEAESAEEAELVITRQVKEESGLDLIVAGVIEGNAKIVA